MSPEGEIPSCFNRTRRYNRCAIAAMGNTARPGAHSTSGCDDYQHCKQIEMSYQNGRPTEIGIAAQFKEAGRMAKDTRKIIRSVLVRCEYSYHTRTPARYIDHFERA